MARKRSDSVKEALRQLEPTSYSTERRNGPTGAQHPASAVASPFIRWLVQPTESLKLIALTSGAWAAIEYTRPAKLINPLSPLLFISYPLVPALNEDTPRFDKGPLDLAFVLFYIVVLSFMREATTRFIVRPIARRLGLSSEAKLQRFLEQAYAIVYFSASGSFGLWVMSHQKSWWYNTKHLWLEYPHWRMEGRLKSYYLLQLAYWCQQMLVLILGLEKPRSDFKELVIHHVVTLWLVGWSCEPCLPAFRHTSNRSFVSRSSHADFLNLTMIGTAIFVSMDLPDICLALSKCLNYLNLQRTSECSFVLFLCVWNYMRHYLNIRILFSVWNEFDLIPHEYRSWTAAADHPNGWWLLYGRQTLVLPPWLKYQIFAPIMALQLVNTFWSFLIWRILWRMIAGIPAVDIREDGEGSDDGRQLIDRSATAVSRKTIKKMQ
ncbi:BQ5605_C044g12160 [Microbotryum silenes-dioicae]|uniref:BQ5605_C044g12160 protein n=1 Tax=Microbotryum silenes-dioicae TaxID=796604 RepID=A0A2X0PNW7_9BASI|nr:BQ5605_C044g12160 [Microbotryum silenes-dioicae]